MQFHFSICVSTFTIVTFSVVLARLARIHKRMCKPFAYTFAYCKCICVFIRILRNFLHRISCIHGSVNEARRKDTRQTHERKLHMTIREKKLLRFILLNDPNALSVLCYGAIVRLRLLATVSVTVYKKLILKTVPALSKATEKN